MATYEGENNFNLECYNSYQIAENIYENNQMLFIGATL